MSFKRFVAILFALVLAPLLVIACFAFYVSQHNSAPQTGALRSRLVPSVVFGGEADLGLTFMGGTAGPGTQRDPERLDIALFVDVSGSMIESLPAMRLAVAEMARQLLAEPGTGKADGEPLVRIALARFDTGAEITADWTSARGDIERGLARIDGPYKTIENDMGEAFAAMEGLVARARPGARRVLVLYTDGGILACPASICPRPLSWEAVEQRARALREGAGVALYVVGLPGSLDSEAMLKVTGDPARILAPSSSAELVPGFQEVVEAEVGALSDMAILTHRIDGRGFAVYSPDGSWHTAADGALETRISPLYTTEQSFGYRVRPLVSGLWTLDLRPPELVYTDRGGTLRQIYGSRQLKLLVLDPWLLAAAFLPALLWIAFYLAARGAPRAPTPALSDWPELPPRPVPTVLPLPRPRPAPAARPVPTLFIGLGGAGRATVVAIRDNLVQAYEGRLPPCFAFLTIDLDAIGSGASDIPAEAADVIEQQIMPRDLTRLLDYLPRSGVGAAELAWFDARRFRDATRDTLDVSGGARGDRMLGRLAFFRWLGQGALLATLSNALRGLAARSAPDGIRQVVIVASRVGGFGGAVMLDVARLLKRIDAVDERPGVFGTEVLGLVLSAAEDLAVGQRNVAAFEIELDTSLCSGLYPWRTVYGVTDPLLSGDDREPPLHWSLFAAGDTAADAAQGAAELGAGLTEFAVRQTLLRRVDAGLGDTRIEVHAKSLRVRSVQVREQVGRELLLRVANGVIGLRPSTISGYELSLPSADEAAEQLAAWADQEPASSPWKRLLEAAVNPIRTESLVETMESFAPPTQDWLKQVLADSLNRCMARAVPRAWSLAIAVGVLRHLADRLRERIVPDAGTLVSRSDTAACITAVAAMCSAAADELQQWGEDLARRCAVVGRARDQGYAEDDEIAAARGCVFIDGGIEKEDIERSVKSLHEGWFTGGGRSPGSAPAVHFGLADAGQAGVLLYGNIGQRRLARNVDAAFAMLQDLSDRLAATAPAAGIATALTEDAIPRLAMVLSERDAVSGSLVIAPCPRASEPAGGRVSALVSAITRPLGLRFADNVCGADRTALHHWTWRRWQPLAAVSDPAFVQLVDRNAEQLRARLEGHYERELPGFPASLRAALMEPATLADFAAAYRSARVQRRADSAGRLQWYLTGVERFLTFGRVASLADAAAGFVFLGGGQVPLGDLDGGAGDFTLLRRWRTGEALDVTERTDLTTLAVMDSEALW